MKVSDKILRELSTLEYILTWGYTDDENRDTKRLIYLRDLRDRCLKIEKIKERL